MEKNNEELFKEIIANIEKLPSENQKAVAFINVRKERYARGRNSKTADTGKGNKRLHFVGTLGRRAGVFTSWGILKRTPQSPLN